MWQIVKNSNQWCVEDSGGNVSQCFKKRTDAARHRDALMVAEVRRRSNELADVAASGQPVRLFNEYAFAEPPEWMPCLPKPGTFQHPSYGEIAITPERNANFVNNFKSAIYQERLPVDAEHQTKLSGACGWIVDMRLNEDGSADAQVEWTDRGKSLIESDRFRYVSPEWYDKWERPDTEQEYSDVIIGAAITNRPFFKTDSLRPLVASENGLYISNEATDAETTIVFFEQFKELAMSQPSSTDVHEDAIMDQKKEEMMEKEEDQFMEDDAVDEEEEEEEGKKQASEPKQPRSFKEAKARMSAAEERAAEAEVRANQFAEALDKTNARIAAMEAEARRKRFAEMSSGWLGKADDNVAVLESFAESFGEGSEKFNAYVAQQNTVATQMRESAIFDEIGSDANDSAGKTAGDRIEIEARKLMSEQSELTYGDALTQAAKRNPQLYSEYQVEMRNR